MGKKPLHRVSGFQAQNAEIFQLRLGGSAADCANSSQEPLHREEIALGKLTGHFQGKTSVSAAEIDLERRTACEQLGREQSSKVVFRQ